MKKELIWKHKFFIEECRDKLKGLRLFEDYEKILKNYETERKN